MRWMLALLLLPMTTTALSVDFSGYDPTCGITVSEQGKELRAAWDGEELALSLEPGRPLIQSVTVHHTLIAREVQPVIRVTTGPRKREAVNAPYTFFDHVFKNESEVKWSESVLQTKPGDVRVRSAGRSATLEFGGLSAGLFHGSLQIHLHVGSPLILVQAVMTLEQPETAYCYEAVMQGSFQKLAWCDLEDHLQTNAAPEPALQPLRVRYRTIMGTGDTGTLAVFPSPHAYLYPKDEADNFGFVQGGQRGIGIRQPVTKLRWSPLIEAPPGKFQRMGVFLLASADDAASTLAQVKKYTHGDTFKEIESHTTLVTHEHAALTVHERAGEPWGEALARAFRKVNIKILQLAEFHGDGMTSKENDTGAARLGDYHDMYAACRKASGPDLLVLPGEEPNCAFPGHWIVMFPRPVYFTRHRAEGQPFKEEMPPYGTVYHLKDAVSGQAMLAETGGLAWTAHARIKGSRTCPDEYHGTPWYQGPQWLGATWKSMPADLSQPRLGVRCLDLLDDMNRWGQRKFMVGEFDCFHVDEASELYGNLNASYLHLLRPATVDDWSPVLDCLRRGDFFVSTGEVLIHSFKAEAGKVTADVEWTFPLAHAEIVACDGTQVERYTVALNEAGDFGRQTFIWPVTMPDPKWLRLEVWDIADDGAMTQPVYLRE